MARFLLDTNIVSFQIRSADSALARRFRKAQESYLAVSTITEAELRYGLALLPPQAKLHATVRDFLENIVIEPWDSGCAVQYGLLAASQQRKGKPLSTPDTMIAAHALAHDLTLVSNDAVFRQVDGLKLQDWTKGPQRA